MFPVSLTKVPVVPRARNELGFLLIQGIPNTCKLPGAELRTCKACWLGLLLAGQPPSSLEAPKDALRLSKVGGPCGLLALPASAFLVPASTFRKVNLNGHSMVCSGVACSPKVLPVPGLPHPKQNL